MVNYTRKVAKGASSFFVFSILGFLFAYLARVFLARNLSTEEFGLFFAIYVLFSFLFSFKDLGLGQALIKYLAEFKATGEENKAKLVVLLAGAVRLFLSFILSLLMFIFAGFLTKNYYKNDLAFPIIVILALWFFVSTLQQTIFQIFSGLHFFILSFLNEFVKVFTYFIFLLGLWFFGFGVLSPAYAWLFSSVLIVIIFLPILLKKYKFLDARLSGSGKLARKLFAFSVPVTLTMVGGRFIGHFDTLILTYFQSLSEVGIYNVILPTALLLLFIGHSLASVIFPVGSELWARNEKDKLIQGLKLMHKYAFLLIIPLGLTLIAFSDLFLRFFFGKEYVAGTLAFQILIVGVIFFMIGQINNSMLAGIGKPKKVSKIIFMAAMLNALVNIIVIPIYGIEGAAVATAVSYLLICVLSIREMIKVVGFKAPWLAWFKTLVGGGFFVLVIYILRSILILNPWVELVLILIVAGSVYLGWIFVVKVITVNEIKNLLRVILRRDVV